MTNYLKNDWQAMTRNQKGIVMTLMALAGISLGVALLTTVALAAGGAPTGSGVTDWLKTLGGNIFTWGLIVGAVWAFIMQRWPQFIALVIGAVVVGFVIFDTDQAIVVIKAIGEFFTQ